MSVHFSYLSVSLYRTMISMLLTNVFNDGTQVILRPSIASSAHTIICRNHFGNVQVMLFMPTAAGNR